MNTLTNKDDAWRQKAHRVISDLCSAAYQEEKRRYPKRKKVRYSVPYLAQELVECLHKNDEEKAKAIFIKLAYFSPTDKDV